eukprot:7381958-Prymnesium_polylepis.1
MEHLDGAVHCHLPAQSHQQLRERRGQRGVVLKVGLAVVTRLRQRHHDTVCAQHAPGHNLSAAGYPLFWGAARTLQRTLKIMSMNAKQTTETTER